MALKDKIEKIHTLKNILDMLMPMHPEYEKRWWQKVRLDWNFNSNHIEGNTLTYGETQLLLMFDKTTGDHELREFEEMKSHDVAIHMVREWAKDKVRDLTEADIRELNQIILVKPYWKEAITADGQPTRRQIKVGEYKEHPNSVRLKNGEMFHYASPLETPQKMAELIGKYRKGTINEPIVEAAQLHYAFILIHPFDDGNGRVARLLTNYVLMKHGYPPIIVKSDDKTNYLNALNKADTGDLAAFHEYIADQLISSLELAIKAAKGEEVEDPEDLDKKLALLEMELQAIDPNEEVKKRLNKEVFESVLQSWVSTLILQVIPVIQKFNKLFTGTQHYISIANSNGYADFRDESPEEVLNLLLSRYFTQTEQRFNPHNLSIDINTSYGTLIKGGLKTFGCNYSLRVKFDLIKYQVYVDEFQNDGSRQEKMFTEKLLHKPLNEIEIKQICRMLGETIYQHIDFFSKKSGLR